MSTPLKALIQERLRAKMVCRRTDYDLDECDSDRLLRHAMDVTAYDITSRGADDDSLTRTGSHGPTSRRSSSTQPSYPIRLHTHIDPSAYLVPSQHDDRYYPPSTSYGPIDHNRPRYSREQYRDTNVYDAPPRPEQQHHPRDQRRRHHSHHRVREQLPPRHEPSSRGGGYITRQPSQNRASLSPWHRSQYAATPSKSSSVARSPMRAASSAVHPPSPSPRAHRKQNYNCPDHFDHGDYSRHRRETISTQSSPRFAASSSSSPQSLHQDYYQRQRYTWKDRDQDYGNEAAYEVREPSPTRHHDQHEYPQFEKSVRHSPGHHKHPNQTESGNSRSYHVSAAPSPHKSHPEEDTLLNATQTFEQPERHSPPRLDMKIIEPPGKTTGRTRAWDDIMSPESRLAAKAFVEKRQRRTEKGTPRTMATQRWLEVVDARASRHEAAAN
ncbi:hypothetical protein PHYPSEUDO_006668 [Phytophthora pseudosyringae]|uniref:Uncharacterized protein n=1 Tax=Phytophthora pseudosyringae TaxID=221518 RepID=A0A8T1VL10_9STRA|nr:hypothetical protein PHYPSEUDO_006668 [Phytophthora pseudosyringae]